MVSNGPLAKYSLTIFSNFPVALQRLEDACHVAMPGQWKNGSDGGSHLYDKPFV
jgi:hypothetical protein